MKHSIYHNCKTSFVDWIWSSINTDLSIIRNWSNKSYPSGKNTPSIKSALATILALINMDKSMILINSFGYKQGKSGHSVWCTTKYKKIRIGWRLPSTEQSFYLTMVRINNSFGISQSLEKENRSMNLIAFFQTALQLWLLLSSTKPQKMTITRK